VGLDYQWNGNSQYINTSNSYNDLDQLTNSILNTIFLSNYQYDALGRLTSAYIDGVVDGSETQTTFSNIDGNGNAGYVVNQNYDAVYGYSGFSESRYYDSLDRLLNNGVPDQNVYDRNGNLTTDNYMDTYFNGACMMTWEFNATNQYGLDNQLLYNSDPHKNITKSYSHELEGRLLKTYIDHYDSDSTAAAYTHTDYYYYSHDGVVADLHDDLGQFRYFTRLGRELLTCNNTVNGNIYYYIQNTRGDVMMMVNQDGSYYSARDYDVNGQLIIKSNINDRDPFGFIGGLDANDNIWKLGSRFYDSRNGSFMQQDRYL